MPRLDESGPFQGSYGQPRETIQHLLGPIWATFRPTKFKSHYVAPQFYFSADRLNCAKISIIEMRTYFSFGLILRDIPNSITPQTTLRLLPIPVGLLVLPCTHQCRRSPSATCARDRRALQQLALNVHVKHSDLTWPDSDNAYTCRGDKAWCEFALSSKTGRENMRGGKVEFSPPHSCIDPSSENRGS